MENGLRESSIRNNPFFSFSYPKQKFAVKPKDKLCSFVLRTFLSKIAHCLFFILTFTSGHGALPVVISDDREQFYVYGHHMDIFEDVSGSLTIHEVSKAEFSGLFEQNFTDVPVNSNPSSSYWVRFSLKNNSSGHKNWLIELMDFRIDGYELYVPLADGTFRKFTGGDSNPFSEKDFRHKNFIHDIPDPASTEQEYFIKIKSKEPVGLVFNICSDSWILDYSNLEYFLLAFFYGLVIAMALYNLFLFFSIRERAYLFYVLYAGSIVLYSLTQDGLGFQYLWPEFPGWNDYIFALALYSMVVWSLLYARDFLDTRRHFPLADKGILVLLIARTIILIIALGTNPADFYRPWLDIIPLGFIYIAGIILLNKGFKPARFYVIAFTCLFTGFFVSAIGFYGLAKNSALTVYAFNFGVVAEMLLLSLSLADRIKILMKEKDQVQKEIIVQLQEKKDLKERINRDLEVKVSERTRELQERNQQLDTFVYRASHDIKGPLRSIMGLTTVGLKDITDVKARVYLEHILSSTKRLDVVLADLLEMTRIKKSSLEISALYFVDLVDEIVRSLTHDPNFVKVRIAKKISQDREFFTDAKLLNSILQNFIENGLKYSDPSKPDPYLNIYVECVDEKAIFTFEDNGLGISKENQLKVFDMFFKVNEESTGTGLGLFLVKLAVEKLQGEFIIDSEPGKGSTFKMIIPESKPVVDQSDEVQVGS